MVFKDENGDDIAFIEALLEEPARIDIIDVRRTGRGDTVEIVISNKAGNIGLNDCEALTTRLDEDEGFRGRFGSETVISVMSPGSERKLTTWRELEKFRGRDVQAVTAGRDGRETTVTGCLTGSTRSELTLATDGEERTIPVESLQSVRLFLDF